MKLYADEQFFCWCCLAKAEYEIRGSHPYRYAEKVSRTCEQALMQTVSQFELQGYTTHYDRIQETL